MLFSQIYCSFSGYIEIGYLSGSRLFSMVTIALLFTGCATVAATESSRRQQSMVDTERIVFVSRHPVVAIAEKLKGKPYRYGGVSPEGFDCSGLMHYVFQQVGLSIPRTTQDQYRASKRIATEDLQPGDLLFFKISSRKLSHVGLYAGNGRFIHASTSKRRVAAAKLDETYWSKRLIGAGRIF
ncbi:MAG: C40 family peptidase [Candidatus Thiodiazotropha lotti]|nr:C40 family peptidase [Candidatus Thiodiazotropha lotti]